MKVTHGTNIGYVRSNNEDAYISNDYCFFAVADGMGGHASGEIASNIMISTLRDNISSISPNQCDEAYLRDLILKANKAIMQKAQNNPELAGMGTTVSMMYFQADYIIWAHVGDSRIYRLRDDVIEQLTTDHSLVNELLAQDSITAEEAKNYPNKNIITRAAGVSSKLNVDTNWCRFATGDIFILCTDGLTNMVDEDTIQNICHSPVEDKANALITKALENGGKDNVTCIVVEL